ncbi:hypothetical protein [Desulfitibacter alkalitolerans]|uniref:hypothetical protein n=1 Tax=Desulfitibacter alkalitolerans TaxID=264641 RepID=UPI0004819CAE|nr:hypothetical protein [Desulfitibacter alkalitolerans]
MNTSRNILLRLINEIPESQIPDVIDFILFLKLKKDRELFRDLELVSESSMDFWNNDIDDEVWNNV